MRHLTVPEADVQSLAYERYHHKDPRVQRHLEILWLKYHGFGHDRIATLAGCSRSTVQRVLCAYVTGGLESLRRVPVPKSHSDLDSHRLALEEVFHQRPPRSV
jgi:hypothetical protein